MRHTLQLLGKNVAVLLASHVFNRLLYIALLGLIGRRLGAAALGGYALASAVGAVFLFVTDLGLSPRLTREVAAQPAEADRHYAQALGAKLAASALALASLPLLRIALPYQSWVVHLCLLMAVAAVLESLSQLNNAVCRARERMELEAVAAATQSVVVLGGSLWILVSGQPPVMLGWAAIAGSAAELGVSAWLARHFVHLGIELPPRWSTIRPATPFAVASLNAVSFFQAELLVLSLIVGQAAVGEFASVSRLLQGGGYLAVLAGAAILPTLTIAYSGQDRERFRAITATVVRASMLAGGAMVAIVVAAAKPIMTLIYGTGFASLAPLLRFGGLFLLLKWISEALSVLLTAAGGQAWSASIRVVGAAGTWFLIVAITPAVGIAGAVLALAVGEVVACAGQGLRLLTLTRRWTLT